MKVEDQVCALEQAEKLYELGVSTKSLFYWNLCHNSDDYKLSTCANDDGEFYNAFTVAELGILLGEYTVMKYADDKNWRLYDNEGLLIYWLCITENEAIARADALIWLLESNYIDPKELKL